MARARMEVLEVVRSEQGFILEAVNITPEGLDQEYERKKAPKFGALTSGRRELASGSLHI